MILKSGIYRLDWDNGYFYIGQSQNLIRRWRNHRSKFKNKSMIKHQNKLYNIWDKYGEPAFNVIEYCGIELLNEREQKYITDNWGNSLFGNTSPSSTNSRGIKRTKPSWQKGKTFTETHRKNLSISHKELIGVKNNGHKLTEEQVIEIRNRYIPYKCGSVKLAKEYNVSYMTILFIVKNMRYSNVRLSDTSKHAEALNNKGANMYSHNGEKKSLKQWADSLNINHGTLESRLLRGWSIEKAITTPVLVY